MTQQPFDNCPQAQARLDDPEIREYICCSPDTCRKLGYCQYERLRKKEKS